MTSEPAETPATTRESPSEERAYAIAFGLLLGLAATLALLYHFLPLVDWPEHLSQDFVVAHLHDARYGVGRYYRTTGWFLPYQTFRLLHIALSYLFGNLLGGRIALLSYLIGTPLAIDALVRRIDRDRWIALATFAVLIEANFLWGFAPQALATTLLFVGLVNVIDLADRGEPWRYAFVAVLGIVLFFTHAQQTAMFVGSAMLVVGYARIKGRITTRRALTIAAVLLPGAAVLAFYLFAAGWISGRAVHDSLGFSSRLVFVRPSVRIKTLVLDSGLMGLGRLGAIMFVGTAAAVVLNAVASFRRGVRETSRWGFVGPLLFLSWTALVFALPVDFQGQTVSGRIVSLACLALMWAPPARPSVTIPDARGLARGAIVTFAAATLIWTHARFRAFDRATRPLERVLDAIPLGSRVATMVYGLESPGFAFPVYLHIGAYTVATRGGMSSLGFTRTGVTYSDAVPIDRLLIREQRIASHGETLFLDVYGPAYDYVLVRTGPSYDRSPFWEDETDNFRGVRVVQSGTFELWRIERIPAQPAPRPGG